MIRNILQNPFIYKYYQKFIGDSRFRKYYANEFLKIATNNNILDIGCGCGNMIPYINAKINYLGIDLNENYIRDAKNSYKSKNYLFINENILNIGSLDTKFDVIMLNGVLISLNNEEADILLNFISGHLAQGGRLVLYDGIYEENLTAFEKFIIKHERGTNLRSRDDYSDLLKPYFNKISMTYRKDLYLIPYPMIICECSNE